MKKLCIVAATLTLAAPLAVADDRKTEPTGTQAPATKAQVAPGAPERPAARPSQAVGAKPATAPADSRTEARPETRDWAKIDTNRDHLISPEEMQKYLEESWAARKK